MTDQSWRSGEILLFTDARQAIETAALRLMIENLCRSCGRLCERRIDAGRSGEWRDGTGHGAVLAY